MQSASFDGGIQSTILMSITTITITIVAAAEDHLPRNHFG